MSQPAQTPPTIALSLGALLKSARDFRSKNKGLCGDKVFRELGAANLKEVGR